MRKLTVYSTSGKNNYEIQTNATAWGTLKSILGDHNINYSGMKAIVGESRVTLESENAQLPEGDFTLFLMPVKTKSGANSERESVINEIKAIIAKNPDAKTYFRVGKLNMTQLSTAKLGELLKAYNSELRPAKEEPGRTYSKPVEQVVESVKQHAEKAEPKGNVSRPVTGFSEIQMQAANDMTQLIDDLDIEEDDREQLITYLSVIMTGNQDDPNAKKLALLREQAEQLRREFPDLK